MELKRFKKLHLILLLIFLCSIITMAFLSTNSNVNSDCVDKTSITINSGNQPKSSQEPFEMIQDFSASTYFISPYTSPGENDEVYFSFMANKKGNYTIRIDNYPAFITDSEIEEYHPSFDNPSGTDLWYMGFYEVDSSLNNFGTINLKWMLSEDKGKTWENNLIKNITAPASDNPLYWRY